MTKRAFCILIGIAVLGSALWGGSIAQAAAGIVRIVQRKLPEAEVRVTGVGYPPKRRTISLAQRRLLAQRAATVDAYRVLAATMSGISGYVREGSGYVRVSGYIKGATVTQVREFADGKIEVDMALPVSLKGKKRAGKVTWDKVISDITSKGYPVYYLRQPGKGQVSEEEWLTLIEKEG